ncbi:MAG: fumarate hydratase class II [Candidatus Pelagisphaera sp.]|jgi:fumarate hydratase class II
MNHGKSTDRIEADSMGEVRLPEASLFGASTQRAVLNFPVGESRMPIEFIRCLGRVKRACAIANCELGRLDPKRATQIEKAAGEIVAGMHDSQFPVGVFQTGSGTSTNMNANEVIANLCSQFAGEPLGSKKPVHPNDHANLSQSSNDVIPTVLHVSVALALKEKLNPSLKLLEHELKGKGEAWKTILKVGRTHTMDAVPVTMGQVFDGYAMQVAKSLERTERASEAMRELAIGGTAVGTGLNAPKGFGDLVSRLLSEDTGIDFREAQNHFEAQSARDDSVEVAGIIAVIAASLLKIASDIRLLGSGPRAGLAELKLPAVQPGSSIMPGKVNPVMCEMLIQVCHYVSGLCYTVQRCGSDGQFELNTTLPLIAHCLHESIECLGSGARTFAEKCVSGLLVDEKRCRSHVDQSLMLVTALNPKIGYDSAAAIAKKAYDEDLTLLEAVVQSGELSEEEARTVLDPLRMVSDE